MGELKVAYGYPISDEKLKRLQSVSRDVRLVNVTDLIKGEYRIMKKFGAGSSEAEQAMQDLNAVLRDVEVFYSARLPRDLVKRAPKMRWLQYVWDGIDLDIGPDILQSSVILTNARQLCALCIAEWVVMVMLMFSKQASDFMADRRDRIWQRAPYELWELQGKTVGVVGLGAIGGEVARLSKGFRMRVLATRRSATRRESSVGYVDELLPAADLDFLLKNSDFVVICVPLTPETETLIGERELRLMRSTSYIINVARGKIIDESALVQALKEGRIAGAGLDVFETEPLPLESELWDLPNVIAAPHITGDVVGYREQITDLFCQNLERYIKGEELTNVVNKKLWY